MGFRRDRIDAAIAHLRSLPEMDPVIDAVGPFTLRATRDRFGLLVRAVLSQQISTRAALTIHQRLETVLAPADITPDTVADAGIATLRTAGLSRAKATCLKELANAITSGNLDLKGLSRLDDETVTHELCQVRGIGPWTAEMFLFFGLARLDIFPAADLGLRNAVAAIYDLESAPDRQTMTELATSWRPYRSIGTWYGWRYLEYLSGKPESDRSATAYPV